MPITKKKIEKIRTIGAKKRNNILGLALLTIFLSFLGYIGWRFGEVFLKWLGI